MNELEETNQRRTYQHAWVFETVPSEKKFKQDDAVSTNSISIKLSFMHINQDYIHICENPVEHKTQVCVNISKWLLMGTGCGDKVDE